MTQVEVTTRWVLNKNWQGRDDAPMVPVSLPRIRCLEPPVPPPVAVRRRTLWTRGRVHITTLGEYATLDLAKRATGDVQGWEDMRGGYWRSSDGLTTIEPVAP